MRRHALALAVAIVASACLPSGASTPPVAPFLVAALTSTNVPPADQPDAPAHADEITVAGDRDGVVAFAPLANTSSGNRVVWVYPDPPPARDHALCVTWQDSTHPVEWKVQPGLLLRWNGQRGITFTRNVWGGDVAVINLHVWDMAKPMDQRGVQLTGFRLDGLLRPDGTAKPLPWRACARARGQEVHVKVWPAAEAEPAEWPGTRYGYGSVVAPEFVYDDGRPGGYVGHLEPGHAFVATDYTASVQ
jgi:hypothetical protein